MRIFGLIDRKNGVGMKAYLVTVATQLYTRFTISCLFSLPKTLCVENERAFGFLSVFGHLEAGACQSRNSEGATCLTSFFSAVLLCYDVKIKLRCRLSI